MYQRCSCWQDRIIHWAPPDNAPNGSERTPGSWFCSLPSLCKISPWHQGAFPLVSQVTGASGSLFFFRICCYGRKQRGQLPWVCLFGSERLTEEAKRLQSKDHHNPNYSSGNAEEKKHTDKHIEICSCYDVIPRQAPMTFDLAGAGMFSVWRAEQSRGWGLETTWGETAKSGLRRWVSHSYLEYYPGKEMIPCALVRWQEEISWSLVQGHCLEQKSNSHGGRQESSSMTWVGNV